MVDGVPFLLLPYVGSRKLTMSTSVYYCSIFVFVQLTFSFGQQSSIPVLVIDSFHQKDCFVFSHI